MNCSGLHFHIPLIIQKSYLQTFFGYQGYVLLDTQFKPEPFSLNHFHEALDLLYEKFNLKPGMQPMITRLSPESYPTLSDLIYLVSNEIEVMKEKNDYSHAEEVLIANKILNYNSILKQLNTLKNAFGKIFDGITSIDNLTEEQIVTYDLSNIKELDPDIFTAVLINILSLSWDELPAFGFLFANMPFPAESVHFHPLSDTQILPHWHLLRYL